MSYQDPPRRQRQPRYPALAQYEDGYASHQDTRAGYSGNGYQDGYQELAGTPQQRPPWDLPQQYGFRGPSSGSQGTLRDSGATRAVQDTGAQGSIWDGAAQRPLRNSGAQQAAWANPGEMTSWDTPVQQTEWRQPNRTGPFYAAPDDASGQPGHAAGREVGRGRGLLPGAVAGFLAAAVALGVANLVAAFVRPQASPIIAVGEAFKNFAVQKFGTNDKNMLLLGMYVTIALIAIAIGILAWRHMSIGVAGIGLFGLFGAFVAITRPESRATDVIPSIVGGIAGIAVIIWLISVAMPKTRYRAGWAGGDL
jgi:hypothetical protein